MPRSAILDFFLDSYKFINTTFLVKYIFFFNSKLSNTSVEVVFWSIWKMENAKIILIVGVAVSCLAFLFFVLAACPINDWWYLLIDQKLNLDTITNLSLYGLTEQFPPPPSPHISELSLQLTRFSVLNGCLLHEFII